MRRRGRLARHRKELVEDASERVVKGLVMVLLPDGAFHGLRASPKDIMGFAVVDDEPEHRQRIGCPGDFVGVGGAIGCS